MKERTEKVRNLINGYKSSYLLIASVRIGLFDILLSGSNTCERISGLLGIKYEIIELILNALVALGLVEKKESYYSLTDFKDIFSKDSAYSQLGYVNYAWDMTEKWRNLENLLINSKKYDIQEIENKENNEKRIRTFLEAMNANAVSQGIYLVKNYKFEKNKILDIGAGYGTHSIIIARKIQNVKINVFDLPMVTKILAENIKNEKLENQIQIVEGDYKKNLPNENYDAIFLFAIIHQDEEKEINNLVKQVYNRLKKGGKLYVTSYFLEENKIEPLFSVMFGIEMLVRYGKGRVYTHSEIMSILSAIGFSDIIRDDNIPGPATLYIAIK
jgi:SAM-dependent methyltransferase